MSDLRRWLETREPEVPEPFREWVARDGSGEDPVMELADAAMTELGQVLARPGRDRTAAFHLLAADGLVTYACEAAAETESLERGLSRLLSRLQRRSD